jgi:hypothetical protein
VRDYIPAMPAARAGAGITERTEASGLTPALLNMAGLPSLKAEQD